MTTVSQHDRQTERQTDRHRQTLDNTNVATALFVQRSVIAKYKTLTVKVKTDTKSVKVNKVIDAAQTNDKNTWNGHGDNLWTGRQVR